MSPAAQRGTPAGDATLAIQRLARQTGGDVQELQTLYVLEALLARISASPYRDDFVLKGGVLLAAFTARRPTKDIDLRASRLSNEADDVAERVRQIAAIDMPDGVIFDADAVTASEIREEDQYSGIRAKLVGMLGRARITVGVDVNFGDPIWPEPELIDLPRIVDTGQPPVQVLGYPLSMVIAEKVVTAIARGEANTRWRDFADVWTLTRAHALSAAEVWASVQAVAEHREVELVPLLPELAAMPPRVQPTWRTWRDRSGWTTELPAEFADVLTQLADFVDPVLRGAESGTWDPHAAAWT
ncbi:MAG TPA: nucleotidyl transferase AbiEii/AbiGii toxin family protein [Actinocatenispora sp.]